MSCLLTVHFLTPGYADGTDVETFIVPDGSYKNAFKVVTGQPGNNYDVRVTGNGGTITIANFTPGNINVSIVSSSNSCVDNTAYDCVNGACIAKTVYSTPGLYISIDACQIACGTGCSGKCISNADWAQIESLSSQIMNKNCS